MTHLPRIPLAATLLATAALAACQTAPPVQPAGGEVTAPDPDPGFLEVRYVEASGPPRQDPRLGPVRPPDTAAPQDPDTPEDPEAPDAQVIEAQRELEREQARRLETERENDTLRSTVRDLEARVLSLSLERSRLEQEVLQLRIDALRAELAALGEDQQPSGR